MNPTTVFVQVALCLTVVLTPLMAQVQSPWDHLEHRTGWIFLGALKDGRWATQLHHVVKKGSVRRVVPRIGDVLELTEPTDINLSGYRTSGERDRLIAPADRAIELDDTTDVQLEPGALVVVRAVHIERPIHVLRGVWVRVSPAP